MCAFARVYVVLRLTVVRITKLHICLFPIYFSHIYAFAPQIYTRVHTHTHTNTHIYLNIYIYIIIIFLIKVSLSPSISPFLTPTPQTNLTPEIERVT